MTPTTTIHNRTVLERMRDGFQSDQRGFGTLDVLLGMAIAALIITIGGINIGKIRDKGQVSEAGSEAVRMGQALDSYVTDNYQAPPVNNGGYPTGKSVHFPDWDGAELAAGIGNMSGLGVALKPDTTIRYYRLVGDPIDAAFTFCAVIQRGSKYAWAYYESQQDSVTSSGMSSGALPAVTLCAP